MWLSWETSCKSSDGSHPKACDNLLIRSVFNLLEPDSNLDKYEIDMLVISDNVSRV
ncbi:hypothetical protein FACS1894122_15660 [Alphaproteobacteria bacterium]|nr:hypothetical protein FACS1894122_15660 [Alphaproteobacteria bacterium]